MNPLELDRTSLLAVIVSLVTDELKALRHQSSHQIGSERWSASTLVGEVQDTSLLQPGQMAIGADSLELVSLATCVATFFNIYDSGLEDYLLRFKTLGEWSELVEAARERGSRNITFATSGSTGTPKQCLQRWDSLAGETGFFASHLGPDAKQPAARIIALSPCHHIYGFIFSVLLPAHLNLPVIRGAKALSVVQRGKLEAGDLIIGFPFIWQQLSRQGAQFPPGVTGITSTGPCDPSIIRELRDQGLDRMVEVYGSSETAGIGFRDDPQAAFRLLPRWIRCQSPHALADSDNGEEYQLSDNLDWADQFHLRPAGRRDEAVQVGGINVFPANIAERLQNLPDVAAAAVRLMAPDEGVRLKAFIVPDTKQHDRESFEARLHAWCARNLSAAERPKSFTFGSQLPCNAMGKQSDWPIGTEAASREPFGDHNAGPGPLA